MKLLAALVLAVTGLVVLASPAGAHAALASTEPASGAVLDESPSEIVLTFTESVQAGDDAIRVFDAAGEQVDTGDVEQPDGRTVAAAIDDLDDGGYVVVWKIVSADGHPIGGAFTWRVGADSAAVDSSVVEGVLAGQGASRAVGVLYGVVRAVVFAGLLVLVGGAAFVAALWPAGRDRRRVRALLWWSLGALAAATVAGIVLQAAETDSTVGEVLETTFGQAWAARLALLVPAAILLSRLRETARPWWRVIGVVTAIALLATPALSGHASSGRWLEVAKALDVLHLSAASVWIGGLAVLLWAAVRTDVADAEAVTARFSPVAFGAVIVVVLTGTGQSIRQVTTLDALETSYGRLLAVKVVIVLALIGIASLTRSALHGRLAVEGEPVGVLRKLVTAEVAVAVAVVAVTALLVDADPGDASGASGGPFNETVVLDGPSGDDVIVNVVAVPGTTGPTDLHVYVDNPAGGLTPPVDAVGTLSLPSAGVSGIDVPFVTAGPSHWSANDVDIPIAGEWELALDIFLTDVDKVSATFKIPIGGSS